MAVVLLALTTACRMAHERSGIVLLIESPPDSLDDRLALSSNGQRIAQLIAPGLITFNDQSEPVADLAQTYQLLDKTTLEFKLREGLYFHNGSPLTAEDVKATFDAILNRSFPSPKADRFEAIARVEAVDARTVRFYLRRPYAPILAELSLSIVPKALAKAPQGMTQDQSPIGAGPFRLSSFGDEEIELLPYDRYYLGCPKISKLVIRVVRDETTRVLELLKGRADLAVRDISPSVLPALVGLRVLTRPGTGYSYLAFNLRGPPLSDRRVRAAICRALDVSSIVDAKFHGLAKPASGMLPQSHWAFAPTPPCRLDLVEARRLLAQAGYGPGSKTPLRLSLKTSTDRLRKSIGLIIAHQLEQVGIITDLRSLEFGTFFNDVRRGNFEMAVLKWVTVIEPDLLRGVFSSKNIPGPQNGFGGWNRGAYVNPHLDQVLDAATQADPAERRRLYQEAQEILSEDLPYVSLWHEDELDVTSSRLDGFEPSAQGFLHPLSRSREVDR